MDKSVKEFEKHLIEDEKQEATVTKYLRDVSAFFAFLNGNGLDRQSVLSYKAYLTEKYVPTGVNSRIAAINCFLKFIGKRELCIKPLKIQRRIFASEERELTQEEYLRLIKAAPESRISLVVETICSTGIRVSEPEYITVDAVAEGKATVNCKNKTRTVFISSPLKRKLEKYIKKTGITAGSVFVTKNGKPLNRSNIWRDMKALCEKAGVSPKKVFPHNLRHLFARLFYSIDKDIVRLADILGHSNINTTRIYTMETGKAHLKKIERLQRRLIT